MSEESQNAPVEIQARKVTLWSTKNGKKAVIMSQAVTWGELQKEINKAGSFSIDGMLATESIRRSDLANIEAVLPETDFVIFFRAKEVKSGSLDRKGLFAAIKEFVGKDDARKQLFIIDGKNMTQLSTPVLQELYDKHIAKGPKSATASTPAAAPAKKPAASKPTPVPATPAPAQPTTSTTDNGVGQVVAITKEALEAQISDITSVKTVVADLLTRVVNPAVKSNLESFHASLETNLELLNGDFPEESDQEREEREAKLAEEEENARLAREADSLLKGFKK